MYINVYIVDKPPHVSHKAGSTSIMIPKAQRAHSCAVTCVAFSKAGIKYKAAELNVYSK